jgi:hypothetical protein
MKNMTLSQLPNAVEIAEDDLMMFSDMSEHSTKNITLGSMVEHLWKMMYEQPVIVRCGFCNSHNIITNSNCIQCGAPGGGFIK